MNFCLLCQQYFTGTLNLLNLFSLKKPQNSKLCPHCLAKFEILGKNRCQVCDKNLTSSKICLDCQNWREIYQGKILTNHAIYRYNSDFHDLMVRYKRYGDYALTSVFGELIKTELSKLTFDCYVPLPTSPEHYLKRQYDTIYEIFKDLKPLTKLLVKSGGVSAQGEKNRQERLKTPQTFALTNRVKELNPKSILLLDDIYTTGRTLYHARDALAQAFPRAEIESFTICH